MQSPPGLRSSTTRSRRRQGSRSSREASTSAATATTARRRSRFPSRSASTASRSRLRSPRRTGSPVRLRRFSVHERMPPVEPVRRRPRALLGRPVDRGRRPRDLLGDDRLAAEPGVRPRVEGPVLRRLRRRKLRSDLRRRLRRDQAPLRSRLEPRRDRNGRNPGERDPREPVLVRYAAAW